MALPLSSQKRSSINFNAKISTVKSLQLDDASFGLELEDIESTCNDCQIIETGNNVDNKIEVEVESSQLIDMESNSSNIIQSEVSTESVASEVLSSDEGSIKFDQTTLNSDELVSVDIISRDIDEPTSLQDDDNDDDDNTWKYVQGTISPINIKSYKPFSEYDASVDITPVDANIEFDDDCENNDINKFQSHEYDEIDEDEFHTPFTSPSFQHRKPSVVRVNALIDPVEAVYVDPVNQIENVILSKGDQQEENVDVTSDPINDNKSASTDAISGTFDL